MAHPVFVVYSVALHMFCLPAAFIVHFCRIFATASIIVQICQNAILASALPISLFPPFISNFTFCMDFLNKNDKFLQKYLLLSK
jgi:hypothetical protein